MNLYKTKLIGVIAACGIVSVSGAYGSAIAVYSTGQSNGGTALAAGTLDPHYSLISAPVGVPLTATAETTHPSYTPNTATVSWIGPNGSGTSEMPPGNYDYQTTFSLASYDAASAQLSGLWASDNSACIFLNGTNTGNCTGYGDFGSLTSFSITSGFLAGTNTLDFIVFNNEGPSGLFANVSGTATSVGTAVTPEPSSWVLATSGLLGLGGVVRRRFRLKGKPSVHRLGEA